MVSESPFDVFDYPFPIYHIANAMGGMNQTTGEFVLGGNSATRIYGNLETMPMDLDERPFSYEGPIVNQGDARLHTETSLKKGDRIKVALTAADNEHVYYRVVGLRANFALTATLLGTNVRREYELKKEDESGA